MLNLFVTSMGQRKKSDVTWFDNASNFFLPHTHDIILMFVKINCLFFLKIYRKWLTSQMAVEESSQ